MKVAYTIDGTRILIENYTDDMSGTLFCAEGHPLIAKRGCIKTHHFAHKANTVCSCSDGMTEWHSSWQDRALPEYQEVRFLKEKDDTTSNMKCHIADVCVPGHIIEFQHSVMDEVTMREREKFYTSRGYQLVWVFDCSRWTYMTVKKYNADNRTLVTLRQQSGAKFPLLAAYTGKITKVFDFGKRELLVVTAQKGASISGYLLTMEDFDNTFLGNKCKENNDVRPFHHSI